MQNPIEKGDCYAPELDLLLHAKAHASHFRKIHSYRWFSIARNVVSNGAVWQVITINKSD
jgi:hypothetical protein